MHTEESRNKAYYYKVRALIMQRIEKKFNHAKYFKITEVHCWIVR